MAFYCWLVKNGLPGLGKRFLSTTTTSTGAQTCSSSSQPGMALDEMAKMFMSNSLLTFHPEERLFTHEDVWAERFVDSYRKRHSRYEPPSLPSRCTFAEMNRKFNDLLKLKQELRQFGQSERTNKEELKKKKQLRSRLLELRHDLLADWLALPNGLEADVPLSLDVGEVVQQFSFNPLYEDLPKSSAPPFAEPEFLPSVGPGAVYYSDNLAVIDLQLKSFLAQRFRTKFLQMSCPDTLRLPVYLGSSSDWPPRLDAIEQLTINNPTGSSNNSSAEQQPSPRNLLLENSFVLCGCSPQTLLGTFAKQLTKKKYFPKLVFSQGELYYHSGVPQQKSVVSFVVLAHTHHQCLEVFGDVAEFLQGLLQSLRMPFECVNVSANRLLASESKRLDFVTQLQTKSDDQSQQQQQQQEEDLTLATFSMHREYFSRRLEMFASTDGTDTYRKLHFPHVASGMVDIESILKALSKRFCVNRVTELLNSTK